MRSGMQVVTGMTNPYLDLWQMTGSPMAAAGLNAALSDPGRAELQAYDMQLLEIMLKAAVETGPTIIVTAPGSTLNPGRWYPRRVEAALERLADTMLEAEGQPPAPLVASVGWEEGKPGAVHVTLADAVLDLYREKKLRAWVDTMPDMWLRVVRPEDPAKGSRKKGKRR